MTCAMYIYRICPASNEGWTVDTGENLPMTEREAGTKMMMRFPQQSLELVFFIASKLLTLFFLFDQARQPKI
jgi:hypothetical protein